MREVREVEKRGGGGQRKGILPKVGGDHRTTRRLIPSGIDWIGDVPEGWKVERVKYHYDFTTGFTPPTSDEALYPDDGDVWVTIADLKGPVVVESQSHIDHEYAMTHINDQTKAGSLMYSFKLSVGTIAIAGADLFTNEAIASFRNTSEISIPFLKYSSSLIEYNAKKNIYNAALLNRQLIRDAPIVFPPLGEQEAIAAKLDDECGRIDSLTAKIEKEIAALEEYKSRLISRCITKGLDSGVSLCGSARLWIGDMPSHWRVDPLKLYVEILPGYAFESGDFAESGVRLLRGVNVSPNGLVWNDVVQWDMPIDGQLTEYLLRKGDLIFGLDRPWISSGTRVSFVCEEDLPCLLVQRVCRIRPREGFDIRWAYYWLKSAEVRKMLGGETTGISVPHVSTNQLLQFKITIPPVGEQKTISDYLDKKCGAIDAVLAKRRKQLEGLAEYRKSVIYSYVTGKKEVA